MDSSVNGTARPTCNRRTRRVCLALTAVLCWTLVSCGTAPGGEAPEDVLQRDAGILFSAASDAVSEGHRIAVSVGPFWIFEKKPILSAHCGAAEEAPPNTLEAIALADTLGYDAVEIDVGPSAEGTPFLMHDDYVDSTTNGSGYIGSLSDESISSLQVNTAGYPEYSGQVFRVPTFEEAVREVSAAGLVLNVDCSKSGWWDRAYAERVVRTVEDNGLIYRTCFVPRSAAVRELILDICPHACISWLYDPADGIDGSIEMLRGYPNALLSVRDDYATDELIRRLNEAGVYYQVYRVTDADRVEELAAACVPMIEIQYQAGEERTWTQLLKTHRN